MLAPAAEHIPRWCGRVEALGPRRWQEVLEDHSAVIRSVLASFDATEVRTEGDSFFLVFPSALDAVMASARIQAALASHAWPDDARIRVRIGMHTGEGLVGGDDYIGIDVHRAARVGGVAHGGQVVISATTADLVAASLGDGVELLDLGEHGLKDFGTANRLYQVVAPDPEGEFPPIAGATGAPSNLPLELTSFVGRSQELQGIGQLLDASRLVTLTGPGGSGKSRLAIRVGHQHLEQFPDGVWFVPLAPVGSPDVVGGAVATALGLTQVVGSPVDHVAAFLEDREALLVIDNFEHVVEAADVVSRLLAAAPRLKVLVTSRSPLRVAGEVEYPVPPLPIPSRQGPLTPESAVGFEGVALFVDRASASGEFVLSDDNVGIVVDIVAHLDGLPLAIELAAARARSLPPEAILRGLRRRLDLAGPRDLPARQRTLRDAISWSHALLDDPTKQLFARLGVFHGGTTLDELEEVAGGGLDCDCLDAVEALVEQSLLVRSRPESGALRFGMLETVREYALEQLAASGEDVAIRDLHAKTYCHLTEELAPQLLGQGRRKALERLDPEHDNIRTGLEWMIEQGRDADALVAAAAMWRYWQIRGHLAEGRARLEYLLDAYAEPDALRADALKAAGGIAYWQGDMDASNVWYSECVEIRRNVGDDWGVADALFDLSFPIYMGFSDYDLAEQQLDEADAIFSRLSDDEGLARILWARSDVMLTRGHVDASRSLGLEALEIFTRLDNPYWMGWSVFMLGSTEATDGHWDAAADYLRTGLELFAEIDDIPGVAFHVGFLAQEALQRNDRERAVVLAAGAGRLLEGSGSGLFSAVASTMPEGVDVEALVGDPEVADLVERGTTMTMDELVAFALE